VGTNGNGPIQSFPVYELPAVLEFPTESAEKYDVSELRFFSAVPTISSVPL